MEDGATPGADSDVVLESQLREEVEAEAAPQAQAATDWVYGYDPEQNFAWRCLDSQPINREYAVEWDPPQLGGDHDCMTAVFSDGSRKAIMCSTKKMFDQRAAGNLPRGKRHRPAPEWESLGPTGLLLKIVHKKDREPLLVLREGTSQILQVKWNRYPHRSDSDKLEAAREFLMSLAADYADGAISKESLSSRPHSQKHNREHTK